MFIAAGGAMAEHIVIAGKSGAGTTTTAVNLSAALTEARYKVAHVGYDPRRTATEVLRGGAELLTEPGSDWPAWANGFGNILCIEAGVGDADRDGLDFEAVSKHPRLAEFAPELVVHDLSGEPAQILKFVATANEPVKLFVVTSPDLAAIAAANAFVAGLARLGGELLSFGGIIANNLLGPFFESVIADFIKETGSLLVASVPHSLMVTVSEFYNRTLIDAAPHSHNSFVYRKLARYVAEGAAAKLPRAFAGDAFAGWNRKWEEIIIELETGLVKDGAGI